MLWSEQISYQAAFPWLPAAYTNPQGLTASYTFDQYGRLSTVTKAGANHVSAQYDYQLSTIPMRITATIEPNTSLEQKSVVYYNGLGQAIQSTSTNHLVESSPADIITKSGFDALNRQVCQSTPFTAAVGSGFINTPCQSQSEKSLTEYDGLGRVEKVTPPDNVPLYTYYNVLDVLTAGEFQQTVTTVDGNGHANQQVLDGFGRLVGVIEYSGTADPYTTYATTQYTYDVLGNLLTVTDAAGNVTSLSYDTLGHKLTMDDPDMGDWSYAYDVYGNLASQTDANGDKICFRYDDLNRLTEKHEDPTPGDVCPTNPTNILSRTIYGTTGTARGQIIEVQWGNSTSINRETFSYDSLGRPAAHTRWVDNRSYTLTYSNYDALNRPATITYPNGQSRTITFDKEGENSLTNSGTTLISNILYNGRGQMTFLDRTWGGVDTTYSYHPAGDTSGGGLGDSNYRLKAIQHAIGNNAWPDFSYEYDKAGNITRLANTFTINNTPKSDTQTFTYDHLNRLLTAQATGGIANYNHTGSNNDYNYDQLGNITYLGNNTVYDYQNWSSSCTGLPTPPPEMPHAVKKIGNQYFCYDDNGNMTTRFDGTTLYDQNFNIENELESVEVNGQTTNFTYDANGIRVKTVQPNGTIIDTPFPDYEVENPGLSSQTVRITLTIAGQAVATRVVTSSTSTYYYLFTDHLGSTVLMASQNSAKNQLEPVTGSRATYYPFGDYRGIPPAQTLTDRGFTGQKSNNQPAADLGLLYYNARYYAPGIARFISADTIVPEPENPQSWNRYSYTLNNPLKYVDPSGHCWGFASGLRNTFLGTTCNNMDMAWSIIVSPDASIGQRAVAASYLTVETMAAGTVVIGSGVATLGCLTGAGTAICAGATSVATAASADGDPTNEITSITQGVVSASSSEVTSVSQIQTVQTGINTVYQSLVNGVTRYIGITNDFARRATEHGRTGRIIQPIPGLEQLSRFDARAVEQVLIEHHGLDNLENIYNSIATNNSIYSYAIQRGTEILKITGNLPQ